ncbi:MAG: hypothetical protein M1827_001489 [Pycnora praestabilis]|nr:MAG: hypothetical protein M1827_001489 [Pycnora praestabilis]
MSGAAAPVPPAAAEDFIIPTTLQDEGLAGSSGRTIQSAGSRRGSVQKSSLQVSLGLGGLGRRTLGLVLLLITVFLWTGSSFLASTIFADNSYSKPYFVTYINTSFFAVALIPIFAKRIHEDRRSGVPFRLSTFWNWSSKRYLQVSDGEDHSFLKPDDEEFRHRRTRSPSGRLLFEDSMGNSQSLEGEKPVEGTLDTWETMKLSLEFCLLWFLANYFTAACLTYTTVSSATILTSTSSVWTLLIGAVLRVEKFTIKKLLGVLASLAGIILISTVDLSGDNDENRGSFPHKSQRQIAVGDGLAFVSAILYGFYTILMKKRIGDEGRVNMPLFFGLVGLFNVLLLWPGFIILHYTGEEVFELPPTKRILAIVLINSASSLFSDFCWAYAMLLTSPLVVTVGLSLTIPLSLVGQMILSSQYSGIAYWIGAGIVFLSFIFINHEAKEEDEPLQSQQVAAVDRDLLEESERLGSNRSSEERSSAH